MEPVRMGNRIELFVDGAMAERMDGAYLKMHKPEPKETVLVTNDTWERELGYTTVISNGAGGYFLYYRGQGESLSGKDEDTGQVTCLCRSADGVKFKRENLGLVPYMGSKQNNIILKGANSTNFTPFLDTNPDCRPDQKFKAIGGIMSNENNGVKGGLYAYASPDGIAWKMIGDSPVVTDGLFDSQNLAFYDANISKYRCYSRYWDEGGASSYFGGFRAIQSCVSDDFINWSKPAHNDYGEPVTEHFYTNGVVPCPGADHILLSFPKRFNQERKKVSDWKEIGISDAVFMASRDGVKWKRLFKESWLRPGPDIHNWTDRNMLIGSGIVVMPDESFSLYYTEHNRIPDNRIRRLSVRKHGFVSLSAGWGTGRASTPPLLYEGGGLRFNYSTSAAGYIKAWMSLADETPDMPADACELYGDAVDESYPLGGSMEKYAGRAVRLHFELKDADLFSFVFKK